MTELQKYELINKCETYEDICKAIDIIWPGDTIEGRNKKFIKERTKMHIKNIIAGNEVASKITRVYGLRQQVLYIAYHEVLEKALT